MILLSLVTKRQHIQPEMSATNIPYACEGIAFTGKRANNSMLHNFAQCTCVWVAIRVSGHAHTLQTYTCVSFHDCEVNCVRYVWTVGKKVFRCRVLIRA